MSATATRLRETVKTKFTYVRPLREADGVMLDKKNRIAKVVIISEGLGNLRDRNYYSRQAVESCPNVFNGRQFFVDHPSESEESDRPERSVRDLAGYFFDCEVGRVKDPNTGDILPACFGKLRFANSEPGRLAMEQVAMALEYQKQFPESKDVYAGISINGGGVSHPATVRGMEVNMVTAIEEAFSADIVTKPARGGRFVALMREAAQAAEQWRKARTRSSAEPARVGSKEAAMAVMQKAKKKEAEKGNAKLKVKEADKGKKPLAFDVDKPESKGIVVSPKAKQLFESIKGQLAKKMQEDGGEGAAVLIDDIKSDLDQLGELLGAAPPESDDEVTAEDETEGEGEAEDEAEDEGDVLPDDDEELGDLGMSDEGEGEGEGEQDEMHDEKHEKPGGQLMRYSCGKCGEANEVAPPKGMQLTKMGESTRNGSESEAVRQLERRLAAKEVRFVEANQKHVKTQETLIRENRVLKSRLGAITRLAEARTLIKEAGVAIDLQAKELLAFPKEQWGPMIEREVRRVKREAEMFGTGAVPRGGNIIVKEAEGKEAISTFRGAYDKDSKS